jgi:hypothetical protein
MALLDDLREAIDDGIFSADIVSSAVLSSYVSPSTDKWGDETASYSAGTNIDVVQFTFINNRLNYQPFGDHQEGDVDFVVRYNQTLQVRDRITWQGNYYFIAEMDDSAFLGNGLVVRVLRCRRIA